MPMKSSAPTKIWDCLIVGGGPAGLTAATYLRRFHRSVALIDNGQSRAKWIPKTHNCPGFPAGVAGSALLARLGEQAGQYGVTCIKAVASRIEVGLDVFTITLPRRSLQAYTVILATGVEDTLPTLKVLSPKTAIERGLLRLCAICDGYEATDASIGVLGPPESALRHACFLRGFSARVSALTLKDGSRASQRSLQQARELNIGVFECEPTVRMTGNQCRIVDLQGRVHRFDTVYAALGTTSRCELATAAGARQTASGELFTDAHMQTSIPGLYAVGDVSSAINQISVAFGQAAIAATAIHRQLATVARS